MAEENKELTQQELSEQNRIRREKLAQMQEAGKVPFQIVKYDVTHHSDEIRANFDALENKDVCIAGRLMSKRIMGKASFCNIQDRNGLMQSYVSKNDIGEEDYAAFKKYDIGDIIGIKGFVLNTKPLMPMISPMSSASRALYSKQKQAKFPYTQKRLFCFPRACRFCPKSSMV